MPSPQPLSQLWQRGEENIKNLVPPRIGGLGGAIGRGERKIEKTRIKLINSYLNSAKRPPLFLSER